MKVHGSLEVKAINTVGLRVNEGLNAQTLLNDVQLDKYAKKNQYYYVQQDRIITLPNATTIPTGWTISFYSNELSEGVIYLHDVSGTEQYKVRPKRSVSIILLDNSTAAGVWKVIESGAGGVGSRNVVITTDADHLFEVSGGIVTLHPFVATVSDGFEEDGVAVEEIIEFREGTAISAPTTFPSTKYIYVSLEALILEETSKQTGGNLFPKTPEQNEIFYNKIERRNYKYIDGEWTPYPCVAVGEIAWTAENNAVATVYPFNEWWWDDKYGDVRNTVVTSSGTVIKSNATEGPNIALAANGISSGEYGNLPIYLQQGFDGIVDTDHMWWSLQTGENVNGTAYLGNINLNEKVTTIKLYQAPYESSYVTSVIVQYSSDNGQSWANLQTYELTMPSAFGEASTLVLPDYTPSASYGLRVLANSGVSNPNAAWQIAELELLTAASGNTVEVGNFVATVSDGYDANGLPIDYVVSLPYTQTVNFTEGQAAYIYVDQYGQVFVDAHKQDGGEELPAINDDYPEGSLFYSIIQGRNYKVVNGAWVESPCVAVGEVAADGTVKVYDFNDWWWRYYDAENVLAHSFFYQNDDEYTTQITLDQVAPSKDVLSVIVSNTLLFSDMYELSGDGLTVTFLSAIEPGTPIEVRWYLPLGTITVDTTGANKDLSNLSEIGQNKLIPLDGQPGYVCTRTETGVRWMPPVGISIGTVFMSDLKYPYVPEGALEYNGTEVLNADTKYPDFWTNWLTAGRMNTGTYEEYAEALTANNGTCPFYAIDLETKSFKTPTWSDGVFPSSAVTESEMDSYKEAGLPSVPGGSAISTVGSSEAFSPIPSYATDKTNADGYKLSVGVYESTDTDLHYVESGGTASGSAIYGKSDTVQPVSVRKRWFVQVANSITTFSGKNIDEIAESALEASQSATESADLAQEWAVKMDGAVADGEYSAKYHAQQAEASATEAEVSASTAATQAANAASGAELAHEWATQTASEVAPGQGYGAKKYAQDAAQSASSAAQSAIDAANSAESINPDNLAKADLSNVDSVSQDSPVATKQDVTAANNTAQSALTKAEQAQSSVSNLQTQINSLNTEVSKMLGRMNFNAAIEFGIANNGRNPVNYTCPNDGYLLVAQDFSMNSSGKPSLYVNGVRILRSYSSQTEYGPGLYFPVSKNDVISMSESNVLWSLTFVPQK